MEVRERPEAAAGPRQGTAEPSASAQRAPRPQPPSASSDAADAGTMVTYEGGAPVDCEAARLMLQRLRAAGERPAAGAPAVELTGLPTRGLEGGPGPSAVATAPGQPQQQPQQPPPPPEQQQPLPLQNHHHHQQQQQLISSPSLGALPGSTREQQAQPPAAGVARSPAAAHGTFVCDSSALVVTSLDESVLL